MRYLFGFVNGGWFAAFAVTLLLVAGQALAAPVKLNCIVDWFGDGDPEFRKSFVYVFDVQAGTVNGIRIGETIHDNGPSDGKYYSTTQVYISDDKIGIIDGYPNLPHKSATTTISRVDGSYKTIRDDGKITQTGQCSVLKQAF